MPSPSSDTSVPSAAKKPPLTVWLFIFFGWLLGGWLVFDGLHQRLFGDYVRIDGQLGPWADAVSAVGLDPQNFGWAFIALGCSLISASFGIYLRGRWAHQLGLVCSLLSLLYLGLGTPAAALCVILLLLGPTRKYVTGNES